VPTDSYRRLDTRYGGVHLHGGRCYAFPFVGLRQ